MNNPVFIATPTFLVTSSFSVLQANSAEVNHTQASLINDQADAAASEEIKNKQTNRKNTNNRFYLFVILSTLKT